MHLEAWTYLAVQIQDKLYAFTHLPFGLAPACKIYTVVMGEVYKPLRSRGQDLTYLIDDGLFAIASRTREQALYRSGTLLLLLTALGFHLSWAKCELVLVQSGKFLGLIVDSALCKLMVPLDKVERIKACIRKLLANEQANGRELASVAGMLMYMSASRALYMAPVAELPSQHSVAAACLA